MRQAVGFLLCWLVAAQASAATGGSYDIYLQQIVRAFDLRPLPTKPFEETQKFRLGRALFFDPLLSGNRDVSCGTCHLMRHGTSDGLAFSIGTGGVGLGEKRTLQPGRRQQPRNALDLWNRDNNWVKSMFWDGRVEVLDPVRKTFRSPLGKRLPTGFDNVMAVQALFPLARDDEMLGVSGDRSEPNLPDPHGNQVNELASGTAHLKGGERIVSVVTLVMERLLGRRSEPNQPWHVAYRTLFHAAYPHETIDDFSIVHVGNAISHFEEIAFATRQTPWDAYLKGDQAAIGEPAKRGAFLFFGKARCAVCHNGPLFSDFRFHSIGVREFGPGIDGEGSDLGRQIATGRPEDLYKFRTPPLRNVTLTAPYFHNGSAATLDEAIRQHLDPLYYADKYRQYYDKFRKSGAFMMGRDQIDAISPVLTAIVKLSSDEIEALKAFLNTLEDRGSANLKKIIPTSVPSGLPIPMLHDANTKSQ